MCPLSHPTRNGNPALQLIGPTFPVLNQKTRQTWLQSPHLRSPMPPYSQMKNLFAFPFPSLWSARYQLSFFHSPLHRRARSLALSNVLRSCHRYGKNSKYSKYSPNIQNDILVAHLHKYQASPVQFRQKLPPHTNSRSPNPLTTEYYQPKPTKRIHVEQ